MPCMRLMWRYSSHSHPWRRLPGFDPHEQADTMAPMVSILTLIRNRDCLMCYLRHRMERIENMRWDVGDMPEDQTANMSAHEQLFTQEYNTLLSASPSPPLPSPPPSPSPRHPRHRRLPRRRLNRHSLAAQREPTHARVHQTHTAAPRACSR